MVMQGNILDSRPEQIVLQANTYQGSCSGPSQTMWPTSSQTRMDGSVYDIRQEKLAIPVLEFNLQIW